MCERFWIFKVLYVSLKVIIMDDVIGNFEKDNVKLIQTQTQTQT